MKKYTLGIDNGTTGSIAVIGPDGSIFEPMPTKKMLMGKAGKIITRVSFGALSGLLMPYDCMGETSKCEVHAFVERPFTGSAMMVNTMVLSARAFEAVLIVLEQAGIGYTVVDSKEWQRGILGAVKGSAALKQASALRGAEMFPMHRAAIEDHGDADSLLIAHYYHTRAAAPAVH